MINQALTIADIATILAVFTALAGLWYRVETRVSSGAKEAMAKAQDVGRELNEYKLEVAENYAKNGFIRDVEQRLGERFDKIVEELHGMRDDFQKAMLDMAARRSSSRSRK